MHPEGQMHATKAWHTSFDTQLSGNRAKISSHNLLKCNGAGNRLGDENVKVNIAGENHVFALTPRWK